MRAPLFHTPTTPPARESVTTIFTRVCEDLDPPSRARGSYALRHGSPLGCPDGIYMAYMIWLAI